MRHQDCERGAAPSRVPLAVQFLSFLSFFGGGSFFGIGSFGGGVLITGAGSLAGVLITGRSVDHTML